MKIKIQINKTKKSKFFFSFSTFILFLFKNFLFETRTKDSKRQKIFIAKIWLQT